MKKEKKQKTNEEKLKEENSWAVRGFDLHIRPGSQFDGVPTEQTEFLLLDDHTRTVVRECCKGDDASQGGNGKFDPLPRPNPSTDHHETLHTWLNPGYLHTQTKFSHDPLRGFFFPCARNCASKMFTRLLFFRVLPTAYSLDAWTEHA